MDIHCSVTLLSKIEMVREGLRRILQEEGFEVIGSVGSLEEIDALNLKDDDRHIILCDISSCGEAISVARNLRTQFVESRIVFMADEVGIENVSSAFGEGIDGYVIRSISCEPLMNVLRLVAAGEKAFPSQLVNAFNTKVWAMPTGKVDLEDLNISDRELQILRCLISGQSNKLIARQLFITEATVKAHVKTVLRKLRVANRTQAAIWAITRGLGEEEVAHIRPAPVAPAVASLQSAPSYQLQAV